MERDFKLSHEVERKTYWLIKSLPKLLEEYDALLWKTPVRDGQPRGTEKSDPTERAVERTEKVKAKIDAIRRGLSMIPEEYRDGVLKKITEGKDYPIYADTATWKRWTRRFKWYVAREMGDVW